MIPKTDGWNMWEYDWHGPKYPTWKWFKGANVQWCLKGKSNGYDWYRSCRHPTLGSRSDSRFLAVTWESECNNRFDDDESDEDDDDEDDEVDDMRITRLRRMKMKRMRMMMTLITMGPFFASSFAVDPITMSYWSKKADESPSPMKVTACYSYHKGVAPFPDHVWQHLPSFVHEFDLLFFIQCFIGDQSCWFTIHDALMKLIVTWWYDCDKPLGRSNMGGPTTPPGLLCHAARLCRAFVWWFGWHGGLGREWRRGGWVEVDKLRWFCAKEKVRIQSKVYTYSSINDSAIHHLWCLGSPWIIQMNQFATEILPKDAPNWLTWRFIIIIEL